MSSLPASGALPLQPPCSGPWRTNSKSAGPGIAPGHAGTDKQSLGLRSSHRCLEALEAAAKCTKPTEGRHVEVHLPMHKGLIDVQPLGRVLRTLTPEARAALRPWRAASAPKPDVQELAAPMQAPTLHPRPCIDSRNSRQRKIPNYNDFNRPMPPRRSGHMPQTAQSHAGTCFRTSWRSEAFQAGN